MSPYLPVTADDILKAAIGAGEAGASILNLHAPDPETGKPTQDPTVFGQFSPRIKQSKDAVTNITTGGSPHMTVQGRMLLAKTFKPEVASLNMVSMNFGFLVYFPVNREILLDQEAFSILHSASYPSNEL